MSDIKNGFTGFANRGSDFESAGDAIRKSKAGAASIGEGGAAKSAVGAGARRFSTEGVASAAYTSSEEGGGTASSAANDLPEIGGFMSAFQRGRTASPSRVGVIRSAGYTTSVTAATASSTVSCPFDAQLGGLHADAPASASASAASPSAFAAQPSSLAQTQSLADALPVRRTREDFDIARFVRVPDVSQGEHIGTAAFSEQALADIPATDRRHAWVEIDLGAIHRNVLAVRDLLAPGTMLLAVVKADAYGHGAVQVAKTAINSGADYLGVATVDEAIQLREADIHAPILILSQPPITSIPLLLAYKIMPSVYDPYFAIAYAEAADAIGVRAPFHLKINTGMNRIGVRAEDVEDFLRQISFHRALEIAGTFTHFACADEHDSTQTAIQLERFEDAIRTMRSFGVNPGIVHAANTAATLRYSQTHFNMVRFGIGLYGIHPCPETRGVIELAPAMSVHARITQVKAVPVGEGVSYGLKYRSGGFARICTIPIGYADGVRRGWSGHMDVLLGGQRHRQVGNVCMDQCMFEVDMRTRPGTRVGTQKVEPGIGDEVVLLGAQGDARITADELADAIGSIPYEVCIGFGSLRLPRVFVS
jgi:alanine racemase